MVFIRIIRAHMLTCAVWRLIVQYEEISDQKEFFKKVKGSKRVVAHFYRASTWRCGVIDKHIKKLMKKHRKA